jgi:TPR repeat protein
MYLPEPTLVQRAQDGDSTSCLDLGKHYFYSTLIKDNFQQAFDWIRRSAEQGHPDAQFWVADLYSLGHGTQQSNTNAYEYYTMAALQGCENALIRLRRIYHDEIMIQCPDILNKEEERFISKIFRDTPYGTRKLYDSRITHIWPDLAENSLISYFCEMFKKCKYADMLNEGNRTKLAFLYHYGYGVVKDVEQAVELYTEAANRGCMDAQYHLACLYQSEMTEYEKSLRWYAAAAHGGHIAAQKHLDYLSRQGFKLDGRFLFDQSKWMDSKASGECTDILDQSGSDIITERYKR